ncbi:MAG: hypothetical protein CUN56_02375 [Phototrophicales bacterium]|nr:MAG: hypothetical protein CUN56_02375 [Phototrophicales bacterium]
MGKRHTGISMLQTIGQYQIMEQVGAGGMATVFKAHQPKLDRYVAIKLMHQTFMQDNNFVARFEREARIVASLDHPNIVPVYDSDTFNGQPYLVMKYVEGRTLKFYMEEQPLTLPEIRQVMSAICDALTYAHSKGVLHRDIKPSNIIIDSEGIPYLTDFGLARIAQQGESTLSVDTTLGTPFYMSPEQAQGLPNLDARTDVYAIGVILYEMMVGRVPFTGESAYAIIHKQIYAAPPRPTDLNQDLPLQVENVLLKALEKDPNKRYKTPNDLMRAFENALMDSGLQELDSSRVEKAKQLASHLQQFTPGGGQYNSLRVDQFGKRVVVVPIVDNPPTLNLSPIEWVELFVQRVRLAIEDMRQQWRDRNFRTRFEEVVYDIREDVQRVLPTNLSSNLSQNLSKIPSPVPSTQAEEPATPRYSNRRVVEINSEWGTDEASIRRRAKKRLRQRRGLIIHTLVYFLVMLVLFSFQEMTSLAIVQGLSSPEFAAEVGARGAQIGEALMPLAQLPWAMFVALIWGSGLVSHALRVFYNSGARLRRKRERIQRDMVMYYGENWQDEVSDATYQRVRRSVEKRANKIVALLSHFVAATAITVVVSIGWEPISEMIQNLHRLDETSRVPLILPPVPYIVMILMYVSVLIHGVVNILTWLTGIDDRERAIQREIARERELVGINQPVKKRKIEELDEYIPPQVRLTNDGEFTESFIDEMQNQQKQS